MLTATQEAAMIVALLGARLALAMMMEAMVVMVQARSTRTGCEVRTHILLD